MSEKAAVKPDEDSWFKRLRTVYPRSLLFSIMAQYFNEGLTLMRMYCFKDLYKRVYEVEPAALQMYVSIYFTPYLFKLFYGMIIDAKVLSSRATILVLFGINSILTQAVVALGIVGGADNAHRFIDRNKNQILFRPGFNELAVYLHGIGGQHLIAHCGPFAIDVDVALFDVAISLPS